MRVCCMCRVLKNVDFDMFGTCALEFCLQAKPQQVAASLLGEGLELEEFGGSVQLVQTSARTGLGLEELTEALLLQVRSFMLFFCDVDFDCWSSLVGGTC